MMKNKNSLNIKNLSLRMLKYILLIIIILSFSCLDILEKVSGVSIDRIKKRGKLIALTSYGANSYFLYRGQAMGFEYELLSIFAKELGVKLELKITKDTDNLLYMINTGEADIIAANIAVTKSRMAEVDFSDYLVTTRQVLVQRNDPATLITNPIDLIGKTVHVSKDSSYYQRLKNLSEEIGGDIFIKDVPKDFIISDIIQKVSKKEIDYTIVEENTALINKAYFPNIYIKTAVSFPQRIAWVVRTQSPELKDRLNKWIKKIKTSQTLQYIYNKYYLSQRNIGQVIKSKYHSLTGGKISQFDSLIRAGAKRINWDWRLLAALVYQESRFTVRARSWAGARGLMQVMPTTAGLRYNLYNPSQNIRAGVNYLKHVTSRWTPIIKDEKERIKFVMASYNAGPGHVIDARSLAVKYGKNPNVWENNVEIFIRNLANPKYFNDTVVKHGYCRGDEPYHYVRQILERFEQYKKFIKK